MSFCLTQCDRFELEAVSLGRLTRCVLSHDGEGPGEGWFCEQVIVRESDNASEEYIFPCNKSVTFLHASLGMTLHYESSSVGCKLEALGSLLAFFHVFLGGWMLVLMTRRLKEC